MALRFTATLLIAGALSAAAPAFADSITLCSGCSNTTVSYNNTGANAPQNTGKPTTGTAVVVTTPSTPIAGTSYISYDPNTWVSPGSPSGTTIYSTTFTGNYAGGAGSIILAADDNVTAFLNGIQIGTTIPSSYNTILGPFAYSGLLLNGLNTLTFNVVNGGGATDLDFKFTAAAAVTPEPTSLLLLGTGLVGVVGTMRKRLFA